MEKHEVDLFAAGDSGYGEIGDLPDADDSENFEAELLEELESHDDPEIEEISRITSYNVCYTKLLRDYILPLAGTDIYCHVNIIALLGRYIEYLYPGFRKLYGNQLSAHADKTAAVALV